MAYKLVVGGQLNKDEIAKQIKELSTQEITVDVKSDLDAAMAVKNGDYDYYVGACETGAGGALAMATALIGSDKTVTVASPSKMLDEDEIINEINNGKVAFGFTANTTDSVLPAIVKGLDNK
ncbi:DUF2620 domain-containing protein [Lactobacillus sp. YT155]|uniref:DUF2620 domain-containing protein n=1 Tax=Lactobacillus sp. YT155 TaxID=3060955 RepID=UPI00265EFCA2|nr:DUF2620 domain-containing protein [Lactobacillus sp. YT155]MDO1604944.1 DUF2620 domain-containing protein [Lactobacillus sp. YT155]